MKSIAYEKSLDFAVRIVKLYNYLKEYKKEYIMSKQLMRSGTSIGANISEAVKGQSRKDFTAKIYIALKEANETSYWLELLKRTEYLSEKEYISLNEDLGEIIKILMATTKTLKNQSFRRETEKSNRVD